MRELHYYFFNWLRIIFHFDLWIFYGETFLFYIDFLYGLDVETQDLYRKLHEYMDRNDKRWLDLSFFDPDWAHLGLFFCFVLFI